MDIAQGDLTKRGRVTEDVLGNVVDAVNLTIEEIAYLLKQVQSAAEMVNQGAAQMAQSSAAVQEKAESQAELSARARIEALDTTDSIRSMAEQIVQGSELVMQLKKLPWRVRTPYKTLSAACRTFDAKCKASPRASRGSPIARLKFPKW